jgi:hypothetical protein
MGKLRKTRFCMGQGGGRGYPGATYWRVRIAKVYIATNMCASYAGFYA